MTPTLPRKASDDRVLFKTNDSRSCQECRGEGGKTESILEDGSGPWEVCGWCEGTGLVTKWTAGEWLRMMKQAKTDRLRA